MSRQPPILFSAVVLSFCALSCFHLFGQQDTSHTKKVLAPEQQAMQQQMKQVDTLRDNLRAQAKQAFDAEMAREKTGDCPNANNTREFNECFDKEIKVTDKNLNDYETAIRSLLGLHYPGETFTPGLAGPMPTPEQNVAELDQLEQAWRVYRDAACTTAFHQFSGGTGGPSFEMECRLHLTRSHMRELDFVYGMRLRL